MNVSITRRYLLVLGLMFATSLTAFLVFEQLLDDQVAPDMVDLSGRERMLVQRVVGLAGLYGHPESGLGADALGPRMGRAVAEIEDGRIRLAALVNRHSRLRAWWYQQEELATRFDRDQLLLAPFLADARLLADPAGEAAAAAAARRLIADAGDAVVVRCDAFIAALNRIGRERAADLHLFALAGEGFTIFLLVLSGLAVFRPLVAEVEAKFRRVSLLENYYGSIIDNVGDAVFSLGTDRVVRFANAAARRLRWLDGDDPVGRPVAEVMPGVAAIPGLFDQVQRRVEIDHQDLTFEASIHIFAFGGDRQAIVALRDITERKQLDARLRTFFYGIEHSPLAIVITGTDGVIKYANRRAAETSGYAVEEMVGRTPRIFNSGQTAAAVYEDMWRALTAGREWQGEILNRRKSGERYWEFEAVSPIKNADGETTHFIAIKEDITEQRAAAAALRDATSQAELANRAKSEFLANMSHELRTPLNAIIGFAEMMKMELFGPLGVPTYTEYVASIYESARHLLGIINDVLDFAKIEAGRIILYEEPVPIEEAVRAVLFMLRERARQSRLDLVAEVPAELPPVRVDPLRFKQALSNLVGNAVKFTPEGGRVTVSAERTADGGMAIQVRDTGIGIKPEDLPRAFERFGQVDATLTRRYEGTGLGLPITKSLVERHGGTLSLESRPGEGTVATIWLPPARVVEGAASLPAEG